MYSAQRCTGNGAGTRVRFTRELRFGSTRSSSPMIARSSSMTASSIALLKATVMTAPPHRAVRVPAHLDPGRLGDELEQVHDLQRLSAAAPACDSGRSDHGQALISVSTSSSCARATRRRLISSVISGFSTGSPPPPPEQ